MNCKTCERNLICLNPDCSCDCPVCEATRQNRKQLRDSTSQSSSFLTAKELQAVKETSRRLREVKEDEIFFDQAKLSVKPRERIEVKHSVLKKEKRERTGHRTSALAKRKLSLLENPEGSHCVRCQAPVSPGFCRTGSVLKGLQFGMRRYRENLPIIGTIETPFQTYIIGGEEVERVKRFGFNKREKGFICDSCAGEYRMVQGQPIVKVDPLPGTIGETLRGAYLPTPKFSESHKRKSTILPMRIKLGG